VGRAAIMEIWRVLPEAAQGRCSVLSRRRPGCIGRIRAHFRRIVQKRRRPSGTTQDVGEGRPLMAGRASRFAAKQMFAALRGVLVKASWWRFRGAQTQLIV